MTKADPVKGDPTIKSAPTAKAKGDPTIKGTLVRVTAQTELTTTMTMTRLETTTTTLHLSRTVAGGVATAVALKPNRGGPDSLGRLASLSKGPL